MIQAVKNGQLRVGAYRHLKSKSRERSGGNIVNAASKRILFSPRFVHSLRVSSLPSGHLQVLPGGRTMSAVSAQQSLHHRGRHALQLPQRLLSWRHGPTRRHVHQWVTPWHWKLTYAHTHTHVYHTWVWLYGPTSWLRRTCTFLYITNTSAVEATKRLIFPHWIIDQYLLWFISTLILCHVFASSLQQRCCPCFGV